VLNNNSSIVFMFLRNDDKRNTNTFTKIFGSQRIKRKTGKVLSAKNQEDTHEKIFGHSGTPYICECLEDEDTFSNVFGIQRQAEIPQCIDC